MHNTAGYSGRGARFVDHRGALEVHRSVDVDAGEQVFYVMVKGAVGGACDVLHAGNNVRTR